MLDDRYFYCAICNEVMNREDAHHLYKTAFKAMPSKILVVGICTKNHESDALVLK